MGNARVTYRQYDGKILSTAALPPPPHTGVLPAAPAPRRLPPAPARQAPRPG